MNLAAPIARPLFTWNSKGVMLEAGQGLAHFLQVPLVDSQFTAPSSRLRPLRWAALAASIVWLLRRRRQSIGQHG